MRSVSANSISSHFFSQAHIRRADEERHILIELKIIVLISAISVLIFTVITVFSVVRQRNMIIIELRREVENTSDLIFSVIESPW